MYSNHIDEEDKELHHDPVTTEETWNAPAEGRLLLDEMQGIIEGAFQKNKLLRQQHREESINRMKFSQTLLPNKICNR